MGLIFDDTKYKVKSLVHEDIEVIYRAFEHIPYVEKPAMPDWQCLSLYVPEAYYNDSEINGYSLHTAPSSSQMLLVDICRARNVSRKYLRMAGLILFSMRWHMVM